MEREERTPAKKTTRPFEKYRDDRRDEKFKPEKKSYNDDRFNKTARDRFGEKKFPPKKTTHFDTDHDRPAKKRFGSNEPVKPSRGTLNKNATKKRGGFLKRDDIQLPKRNELSDANGIRLNKYLANAGVAARRKCDELIAEGNVKVNGKVVMEMGHKVMPGDKVTFRNKLVEPVNYVYILLNKPKDYLTTVDDDRNRHTVMELIEEATSERVYPVGRLDRNTTGLLLLTNDGDLAQKLSHPSFGAQKIYEVELDKVVSPIDIQKIAEGIELEDGLAMVDGIDYAHHSKRNVVGVSLHIGKNRIVRRIFESLGYRVERLDRTFYAGLTKRDLPRGRWRHLTEREIIKLKFLKS